MVKAVKAVPGGRRLALVLTTEELERVCAGRAALVDLAAAEIEGVTEIVVAVGGATDRDTLDRLAKHIGPDTIVHGSAHNRTEDPNG